MLTSKKILYIFTALLTSATCFGQDLPQSVLQENEIVIDCDAFEIKSKLKEIDVQSLEFPIDQAILDDLKIQAEKEKPTIWRPSEFPNRIIVSKKRPIDIETAKSILQFHDKEKRRSLIRDFKKYNSGEMFYRSFPLSISKPIYSADGNYAVIGYSRGNNGGRILLYMRIENSWKVINNLKHWAY
ncbi:hypothetical protein [Flavobacterium lindanitolerans]|uniref:hypothetical protein n=1 Tax=Flavobacterium lindanitolerans TaxID=428988 RepID=UPI0031B3F53B